MYLKYYLKYMYFKILPITACEAATKVITESHGSLKLFIYSPFMVDKRNVNQ